MPSVKLSPLFNEEQFDNNGIPLSGGKVYWYIAGTSTIATTYTDSAGSVADTNPVILNTRGEPSNPIWLPTGSDYKAVLTDSADNVIRTVDNISGVNDTAVPVITEWVLYSGAATYIDTTHFSVTGDLTATFTVNRRLKATVSGGDIYGTISGSSFAAGVTTVTLQIDSGVLDIGLSSVYYGFLNPTYPSIQTIIPAGTKMLFMQAAAPTGWTEDAATFAGRSLYIKDGTHAGATTGGSHNPLLMNVVPTHTHPDTFAISSDAHTHTYTSPIYPSGGNATFYLSGTLSSTMSTGVATSSDSHTHALTGAVSNNSGGSNWTPKYAVSIVCTKN